MYRRNEIMDKQNQKAAAFRKKAADLRASTIGFSPELKTDLEQVARRYELLADKIERSIPEEKDSED